MMKELEVKGVKFYDDELLGVRDVDGVVWLGVKKTMKDIGLTEDQAKRQVKNLQSDLVLSQGVSNLTLHTNGGEQESLCIKEDFVTLWLAKISITPKMQNDSPIVVDKLVKYQLECAKVLHEAFMGTEEKREDFYNQMGLEGKIVDLEGKVDELTNSLNLTTDRLNTMIDNTTINSRQASRINSIGREHIVNLLGGTKSPQYKKYARMAFKRFWNLFNTEFNVTSYRDLNPCQYNEALVFCNLFEIPSGWFE